MGGVVFPPCYLKWSESEVKITQSCLTLCNPVDCSIPHSSVHGIFQARIWSGLPFPFPGHLPNPGIKSGSPALQAQALPSEPPGKPGTDLQMASFPPIWPLRTQRESSAGSRIRGKKNPVSKLYTCFTLKLEKFKLSDKQKKNRTS